VSDCSSCGPDLIDHAHELADGSVCTVMTFVLRDVLEYPGLTPSKDPVYSNELKICSLKQKLYQKFAAWA
jgi:hypothetical protein